MAKDDDTLMEAVDTLCEFCTTKLADGWEIRLTITSDECSIELLDDCGAEHHVDHDDGVSIVRAMCTRSNEVDDGELDDEDEETRLDEEDEDLV